MSTAAKVFEATQAVADGADEIDMVINVGWLKAGATDAVRDEIRAIKQAIGTRVLKVIIETCYLTDDEKALACKLSLDAGADFVKTSTGFGTGGATFEDVQLMLNTVDGKAAVKASGGVRDIEAALKYVAMGVKRLGTSNGIKIVSGETVTGGY
jgi:deoxyribose-phosphate aldolase